MAFSAHWSWFALFCLFNTGNLVQGLCPEERLAIEGGTYTLSNQFEEGSLLEYHCEEGYHPHPHLARVCHQNDMWEPAPRRSKCRQVECPDPTVLENGNVFPTKSQYFYKDEISVECYEEYKLYGSSHRICLESGKWSGQHSVCRRDSGDYCPDPGIPPGGSKTGTLFDIGEKVTYTCQDPTMILIGSEERVCQEDGHWSGTGPTCYYQHTYDTPIEISNAFGRGIKNTFSSLQTEMHDTQEGRKIKLTKDGILNMYIAVDISSSMEKHIGDAKVAVLTLIEKLASFSVSPNYDIIFFSSKPLQVVNIMDSFGENKKSLSELVEQIKTFEFKSKDQAGTNLNKVFEKFLEKMALIKIQQSTDFEEHQHVIIIFTDGAYNMGGKPLQTVESIKALVLMNKPKERQEHLDIYIFGVGTQIYDTNLQSLTFGPPEQPHYFRLKNEKLHETLAEIIDEEDIKGLCGLHRNYGDMSTFQAKRNKYPWFLSISVMTEGPTSLCLGSLVSPRFVLTAAHCFTLDHLILKVNVEIEDGKPPLEIEAIHKHPDYNISSKVKQNIKEFYDYDVALIELKKDVNISTSLRPICLPCTKETNEALKQNLTCLQQEQFLIKNHERITFLTKNHLGEKHAHIKLGGNRQDCIIKALDAPGIANKDVSEVVTENFFCTGGIFPETDKIACKGDSGGAVFKNHLQRTIQVAVVSWGNIEMRACLQGGEVNSDKDSRDFHFNLFKAVPFLKSILGKTGQRYASLDFVN
ncbi:complement factor B-like [Eucyclogobius newberryi]|uniref:complement factor B-like n=1 Tax=Eucyclogobius newberryi TaxID=166745 RepID=UPI003B5B76EB